MPQSPVEILEQRARQLAVPVGETRSAMGQETLVTFFLGDVCLGIAEKSVIGVARLRKLDPVPGAPAEIAGITMFQGDILVLVDLRVLLGVQASAGAEAGMFFVLADGAGRVGILVDLFGDMISMSAGDLKSVSQFQGRAGPDLMRGMTPEGLIIVNPDGLLARLDSGQENQPQMVP